MSKEICFKNVMNSILFLSLIKEDQNPGQEEICMLSMQHVSQQMDPEGILLLEYIPRNKKQYRRISTELHIHVQMVLKRRHTSQK